MGAGAGGTANPLTSMILLSVPNVLNRESPVTGSTAAPTAPGRPVIKSWLCAMIGSPLASKGAVTILSVTYFAISALLGGNSGEPGGTKAMPSASPMFVRRLAELMLNVPLLSGLKSTSYQSPPGKEPSFILPAPGKPCGTKASDPTDEVTPKGLRLVSLLGVTLPSLVCSS